MSAAAGLLIMAGLMCLGHDLKIGMLAIAKAMHNSGGGDA